VKTLYEFSFSLKMTKVDSSYLLDSNYNNEKDSKYYDDEYHDNKINFDNLDLNKPLKKKRDILITLTFHNKKISKV